MMISRRSVVSIPAVAAGLSPSPEPRPFYVRFTCSTRCPDPRRTAFRGMRRLWLVLLCAALVFAPSSAAAGKAVDRGIVMRVQPPRLPSRQLDGGLNKFVINPATVITLAGRRGRLR